MVPLENRKIWGRDHWANYSWEPKGSKEPGHCPSSSGYWVTLRKPNVFNPNYDKFNLHWGHSLATAKKRQHAFHTDLDLVNVLPCDSPDREHGHRARASCHWMAGKFEAQWKGRKKAIVWIPSKVTAVRETQKSWLEPMPEGRLVWILVVWRESTGSGFPRVKRIYSVYTGLEPPGTHVWLDLMIKWNTYANDIFNPPKNVFLLMWEKEEGEPKRVT